MISGISDSSHRQAGRCIVPAGESERLYPDSSDFFKGIAYTSHWFPQRLCVCKSYDHWNHGKTGTTLDHAGHVDTINTESYMFQQVA
jgi:hypothetical protein